MDIKEILNKKIEPINSELTKYLEHTKLAQNTVFDAMSYSVNAGGKRLRPVIMLLVCDMLKGNEKEVLPFACALEMIHTYSLIHDDLPAMDNDDLRRGKPTNHKVYGEAMAILAGDSLLNKAFEITSSVKTDKPEKVLAAISELSKSSGAFGMIGGQVIDIESEGKSITPEELLNLHILKTGAIIRSAGTIGAILSDATDEQIKAIDNFCLNLGIAFQIQDDILDVLGNEDLLGKPIGSDEDNNKTTFVTLFGIDKAKAEAERYTNIAIESLSIFGKDAECLIALAQYLTNRKY